jgi:long-chain fatty acid transport protein
MPLTAAGLLGAGALAAFGGGIQLYELGTADVGLASAGYAARPDDASTLFKNPAGLSLLPGDSELTVGMQLLYGQVQFSPDGNTTPSGGDGGNPVGLFPGGGIFFAQKVSAEVTVGFGAFSYFGLAQSFDEDWVGRYFYQEGGLAGVTFMPSVGWKASDWLSFGVGLNAMYGVFSQKVAVNNVLPGLADGQLDLNDATWGFGADLGVIVTPAPGTRLGLTYLSPVSLNFKDTPSFTGLGPGMQAALGAAGLLGNSLDLGITVPQSVMLSGTHDVAPGWTVMADLGWQQWSQFGKVDVSVDSAAPVSLTADRNYLDTYHGAIGVRHAFSPAWSGTIGFAYDSSAVSDEHRTVDFAVGSTYRIGAGAQWKVSGSVELGAAYELMWCGNLPVDQYRGPLSGRVSGSFDDTAFHFVALNLDWRF